MLETDVRLKSKIALVKARAKLPLDSMVSRARDVLLHSPVPKPRSALIIAARMRISNDRSLLLDDRIQILRELSLFRRIHAEMNSYLIAKYTTGYLGNLKSRDTRLAVVEKALWPVNSRISRMEAAVEAVNIVVSDLDAKSFALRDIMEALKLGERES